ncbi:hypothetical protein DPMN_016768 [Dreissena polymorpha]|uniref:Uncharacterized protein n=1 Tax=Dreissena polymorpha TaxID=45954 RepID=A0A9D4NDZ9_DREPO|nr:hypothetical protein DPMN_016768 [Dreissena polymorpha]
MSKSTPRQELCPIWKQEIEISKNNWSAIEQKGVKGKNEASVNPKDDLIIEDGTKVHTNDVNSTHMIKTLTVMLKSKVVVLYKRVPQVKVFERHKGCILCGCKVKMDTGHLS